MTARTLAAATAAIAAVAVLAGCSSNDSGSTHSGHDMSSMSMPASDDAASAHDAADVMFAQMMIPHHRQAVQMSDMLLAKGGVPTDVRALASKIKDAQTPEITTMTGWLKAWGEPVSTDMSGHHMEGMVSDADLAKLKDASGADAAKLYLAQMIGHHEGAIGMAKTEIAGGKNPDALALARSIVDTQQKEIDEMKKMQG